MTLIHVTDHFGNTWFEYLHDLPPAIRFDLSIFPGFSFRQPDGQPYGELLENPTLDTPSE